VNAFLQTIVAVPPVITLGGYVTINRQLLVGVSSAISIYWLKYCLYTPGMSGSILSWENSSLYIATSAENLARRISNVIMVIFKGLFSIKQVYVYIYIYR